MTELPLSGGSDGKVLATRAVSCSLADPPYQRGVCLRSISVDCATLISGTFPVCFARVVGLFLNILWPQLRTEWIFLKDLGHGAGDETNERLGCGKLVRACRNVVCAEAYS